MKQTKFDIVFMDLHMPIMDGWEAMSQIQNLVRQGEVVTTPVFALTADAFEETEDKCKAAGFDGFITKPLKLRQLRAILNENKQLSG